MYIHTCNKNVNYTVDGYRDITKTTPVLAVNIAEFI